MRRPIEAVLADLNALQASDFEWNNTARGIETLDTLIRELESIEHCESAIEPLFQLMERAPEADLGVPGAIVHWLEKQANYMVALSRSLKSHPTPTTVWMANRIINSQKEQSKLWLSQLEKASQHPRANDATRESALDFLKYQSERQKDQI